MSAPIPQKSLLIGNYQAKAIPTGIFGLDGGSMFGTVPKVLWEKTNPPDAQNRIPMEARALLLISPERKILIDTGVGRDFTEKYGEKLGSKFAEIYAVSETGNSLEKSLRNQGLTYSDITDVILTHLHFDHAGGATCWRDGRIQPTFPKARYYVQKANLEAARQPNLREKASYLAPNFEPLVDAGVLELLEGSKENLLPNISVIVSNGHTQGQQMVKISEGSMSLVYCGDVIPTSTHVRLAWVMGYDLHPLQLIEEKRVLLTSAAEKSWILFFEHDPYADCATVTSHKEDFAVAERFALS